MESSTAFLSNSTDTPDSATATHKLERLFCMQGGDGETSYARNSQGQAKHLRSLRPLLEEALNNMDLPANMVTIADLGCSSGQNTLVVADNIVNYMTHKYKLNSLSVPEFQVFFSDLPSNDFNTLFQLLPPRAEIKEERFSKFKCSQKDEPDKKRPSRMYYAAGVPGSFYKRLFPSNTLDFVHSSFSLHWLSQVPEIVQDRSSVAWNKGRVFIHKGSTVTARAYREQFKTDLESFLKARSKEMKRGGCMFLVCLGRTFHDPSDQGGAGILFGTHFEQAWNDLVQEGLIEAERRDSFNVPFYAPTAGEFGEVVEKENSFAVHKVDIFRGGSPLVVECAQDNHELARAFTNSCRSVCGVLVDDHLGKDLSDQLFCRMEKLATEHAVSLVHQLEFFHVVASLTKK